MADFLYDKIILNHCHQDYQTYLYGPVTFVYFIERFKHFSNGIA
jgi:hypothetical protein